MKIKKDILTKELPEVLKKIQSLTENIIVSKTNFLTSGKKKSFKLLKRELAMALTRKSALLNNKLQKKS